MATPHLSINSSHNPHSTRKSTHRRRGLGLVKVKGTEGREETLKDQSKLQRLHDLLCEEFQLVTSEAGMVIDALAYVIKPRNTDEKRSIVEQHSLMCHACIGQPYRVPSYFVSAHDLAEHARIFHSQSVDEVLDIFDVAGKTWDPKIDSLCEKAEAARGRLRKALDHNRSSLRRQWRDVGDRSSGK